MFPHSNHISSLGIGKEALNFEILVAVKDNDSPLQQLPVSE